MTPTLRPYQREAVDAVWASLRGSDLNPAVVLPTGAGKGFLIAELCREAVQTWNGRVLVLAHVRELLEQAADKLRSIAPDLPIGIFSAGLGRRDIGYAVTIAGIQSVYQRGPELGPMDLIIVDECHLISPDGEGMYRRLLSDIAQISPHRRVVGLTATPYRTKTGMICGPDNVLNEVCFEVGVRELVVQGYLSPLRSQAGKTVADTDSVHIRGGEFVAGELEDLMSEEALVQSACREIVDATTDRSSVLIFCSGVRHGERVSATISELTEAPCGFITGDTPAKERDQLIEQFKRGELKYLANVNVLTTGFDAPNVDCVVMLRPTMSPGLFCQMVGRGFRLHPGKEDCLVLDFGGNVLRHGPVDAIRLDDTDGPPGEAPAKQCPSCNALIATGYAVCPQCGHVFPPRQKVKHKATASDEAIMSDEETSHRQVMSVSEVSYHVHLKRGDPMALPTMRVEYRCNLNTWVREWICFEHPVGGYARGKAAYWWRQRSNDPIPESVQDAVDLANAGALATPTAITVEQKPGDQWERIVGYQLGDTPPKQDGDDERDTNDTPAYVCADDGIPF